MTTLYASHALTVRKGVRWPSTSLHLSTELPGTESLSWVCTHELHPPEFPRCSRASVSCDIPASPLESYSPLSSLLTLSLSRADLRFPFQVHLRKNTCMLPRSTLQSLRTLVLFLSLRSGGPVRKVSARTRLFSRGLALVPRSLLAPPARAEGTVRPTR